MSVLYRMYCTCIHPCKRQRRCTNFVGYANLEEFQSLVPTGKAIKACAVLNETMICFRVKVARLGARGLHYVCTVYLQASHRFLDHITEIS